MMRALAVDIRAELYVLRGLDREVARVGGDEDAPLGEVLWLNTICINLKKTAKYIESEADESDYVCLICNFLD